MSRQFFTADDIRRLAAMQPSPLLVLGAEDVVTAEAEECAATLGIRLVREISSKPLKKEAAATPLPPLRVVHGQEVALDPFGQSSANVHLKDVITSKDGAPMASGYMTLEKGEFPWTLTYDEIDVVLEGELIIRRGGQEVRGLAGDMIYIPRGSSIVFATTTQTRFAYITFPANWNEK